MATLPTPGVPTLSPRLARGHVTQARPLPSIRLTRAHSPPAGAGVHNIRKCFALSGFALAFR